MGGTQIFKTGDGKEEEGKMCHEVGWKERGRWRGQHEDCHCCFKQFVKSKAFLPHPLRSMLTVYVLTTYS